MATRTRIGLHSYLPAMALVLVVLAQPTVVSRVTLFGVHPDLALVAVVCWSLVRGVADGLIWGFGAGLGIDLIAGTPLGTSSLALMPVCFVSAIGSSRVFASSGLLPMLLVALATPLHGWIVLATQGLRGHPVNWLASTTNVIAPAMLLNALLAAVVYPLLRWWAGRAAGDGLA